MGLSRYILGPVRSIYRDLFGGDPRGNLKTIPLEIILSIVEYLPKVSLVLFSLTCTPYYQLLSRYFPSPKLLPRERQDFWQILEKDISSHYFCDSCVRLHKWDTWFRRLSYHCLQIGVGICVSDWRYYVWHYDVLQPLGLFIPFPHARLVMNRHLYGPSHGFAISKVEHGVRTGRFKNGGRIRGTTRGRIIDNELFLKRSLQVWHTRGEDLAFRQVLAREYITVCEHINLGPVSCFQQPITEVTNPLERLSPCEESLGSCSDCLTDYSLCITWRQGHQKGWLVSITVYQQLGPCRSPRDWKWDMIREGWTPWHKPRCYREDQGPGVVRRRWYKADGVDCAIGGKFLGRSVDRLGLWCRPGSRDCRWRFFCPVHCGNEMDNSEHERVTEG